MRKVVATCLHASTLHHRPNGRAGLSGASAPLHVVAVYPSDHAPAKDTASARAWLAIVASKSLSNAAIQTCAKPGLSGPSTAPAPPRVDRASIHVRVLAFRTARIA